MAKKKRYFMYGTVMTYSTYLQTSSHDETIEDVLQSFDNIEGMFTGRNGEFVIMGKILKTVDTVDGTPLVIPQLSRDEEKMVEVGVDVNFRIRGEYHYYFIIK